MLFPKDKLQGIVEALDSVIDEIHEFENKYQTQLSRVHPKYSYSAKNLVHYLAMRSFNINVFQDKLEELGLPIALESQNNILFGLLNFRAVINSLLGNELFEEGEDLLSNKDIGKNSGTKFHSSFWENEKQKKNGYYGDAANGGCHK